MVKKIALLLAFWMVLTNSVFAKTGENNTQPIIEYLQKTVENPSVGAIGGEWTVFGLARSGEKIPDTYFQKYYENVETHVKERKGILHERKYTEYARVVLALSAIGKDPTCVAGHDLTAPLMKEEQVSKQGINGIIWALIALDSKGFGDEAIREEYVKAILNREIEGGGWALTADAQKADADVTAMAMVSLSPYKTRKEVSFAIERGINALSKMQKENGGFAGFEEENAESSAQVLLALSVLGIAQEDMRFVKNGNTVLDYLLSYQQPDGGFAHLPGGKTNLMATEQALYALVSYERMISGKTSLFDMSNVTPLEGIPWGLTKKHADVQKLQIMYPGKTFDDIQNHPIKDAIEGLSCRGVIQGITEQSFCPDGAVTRAEFAALVVRALGLKEHAGNKFTDIHAGDWFETMVNTASVYGIVHGVSHTEFFPHGTITRQESACMIQRASELCGMETAFHEGQTRDILASFTDYQIVEAWATDAMAFCYDQGILDDRVMEIKPYQPISRAEVVSMLYTMLERAALL